MDRQIARDIQHFANLLSLDAPRLDAAKVARGVIEPHMPALIEAFYEHLFANGLLQVFEGRDLSRLKGAQHRYWNALLAGGFDGAYEAHVLKINMQHYAAGVDLSDYIAAYAWFSARFTEILARTEPPHPFARNDLPVAVNKVIYLDITISAVSLEAAVLE